MKRKCLAVVIILLFIGTAILPSNGEKIEKSSSPASRGHWLYVGGSGPGNYTKIQDAINDSNYGDTVFVYSGVYYEQVFIETSGISLVGEDKNTTIIDGNNLTKYVVEILGYEITVKNFTIRNCKDEAFYAGVYLEWSPECIITENNITKNKVGIYFSSNVGDTILSNNIIRNNQEGIYFPDSNKNNIISNNTICFNGDGIISNYRCDNNTISGNNLYENEGAIDLCGSNNTIMNNSITSNKVGIGIYYFSSNNVISHNKICNIENFGIDIYQSDNNSISNNIITDCGWRGIDDELSDNNTITKNCICNVTGQGIMIARANGTLVFYNTLKKNDNGIDVYESKSNNFSSNNFIHNVRDAVSSTKQNTWQGNYWERPRGLPKPIFGYLLVKPIIRFFLTIQFDWHPAQKPYDIPGMS
jgi:parallel beta-helix repeat protein